MEYNNQTYTNERIELDGNEYNGCTFTNCTFTYRGGLGGGMNGCTFTDYPRIAFDDCAGRTLNFLHALYHGGFQRVVEDTFNNIRVKPE